MAKTYPLGGTAFIDMNPYGEVTTAVANDIKSNEYEIASQLAKPVVVVGLNLKTVGKFSPFVASFVGTTSSGTTTYTAALPAVGGKIGTIAVASNGKITVTKGA